jgi:hypothetical protein
MFIAELIENTNKGEGIKVTHYFTTHCIWPSPVNIYVLFHLQMPEYFINVLQSVFLSHKIVIFMN